MKINYISRENHSQESHYIDWFELESGIFGVVRLKPDHAIDDSTPQNLPIIVDSENYPINTDDQKHIFLKDLLDVRVFTEHEFKAFLSRDDWQQKREIEVTDYNEVQIPFDDSLIDTLEHYGICSLTSRLDGIEIVTTEGFRYLSENPESFVASSEGLEKPITINGPFFIVDEDGENITGDAIDFIAYPYCYRLLDIDYSDIIDGIKSCDNLDSDSIDWLLEVDNQPDLSFNGELIVHTSSNEKNGRWTYLELYKTNGGKYVCYQVNKTCWQGERDFRKALVISEGLTEKTRNEQIISFFGQGWLAKDLYFEAKIDNATKLD